MCNRFLVAIEKVAEIIDAYYAHGQAPQYALDVRPTDAVPVLARDHIRGRYELITTSWGLIPRGAKEEARMRIQINARAETLCEKSLFQEAFRCRRCVIPASEFFEFDDTSRYRVAMKDGSIIGFAGLFEPRRLGGKGVVTSTMITTEPNDLIAPIHPRMPAILRPEDWEAWLDPTFFDVTTLMGMLQPFPSESMMMTRDGPKASAKQSHQDQPRLLDRPQKKRTLRRGSPRFKDVSL
jgi:putative SOS response-associated peptidase YedK